MPTWKRFILLIVLFGAQSLYFPINQLMEGGLVFKTTLDQYIPLWPIWAVPYLLYLPLWITCFIWAAFKMEERMFKRFFASALAATLIGISIFLLFPTYIERPVLVGNDWATELLRYVYGNDDVYNAFPSGHVYLTTLISLFWMEWYTRYRWLWIAIVVSVLLSTLFTHQHYLPDLAGGLALAKNSIRFGNWWALKRSPTEDDKSRIQAASLGIH
jgi:membrane-associated phospholipid phosphatase